MEDAGNIIDNLIISQLSGESGAKESEELLRWMEMSPENKKYFQDMQEIWFASACAGNKDRFNPDEAYRRFLSRTSRRHSRPVRMKRAVRLALYGSVAAVLILVISYLSYRQGNEQLKNQFADIVIEIPEGSKTKMYLPDGTLVWLNANSKIAYSQGFGVNERNVSLTGEGYFEVAKNEKLPFCVKTDELCVAVKGTKFDFKNYPDDDEATVSLLEGKVWVNNSLKKDNCMELFPHQKVFLNKKTGKMHLSQIKAQYIAGWVNGYLFFDEELLPDIVKDLERSYQVTIRLADPSLQTLRFYGNFAPKEQTIEEILNLLASTNKLKYSIKGKEIVLSTSP